MISATPATAAAPAAAPPTPPTPFTVAPATTPTGVVIMQLKDLTLPTLKMSYDTVTNTQSPVAVDGTVTNEYVPTVVDGGDFTATGIFNPLDTGLAALQTAFFSGLANAFQVQLQPIGAQTSGNVYQFNAFVSELPVPTTADVTKALTYKISLKLSGLMTVLVGATAA